MELPEGLSKMSPALAGAFQKGMAAYQNGQSITDCPYEDHRKPDGRLSWSRAFRNTWRNGWQWAAQQSAAKE